MVLSVWISCVQFCDIALNFRNWRRIRWHADCCLHNVPLMNLTDLEKRFANGGEPNEKGET
jgi:hypothetical protein